MKTQIITLGLLLLALSLTSCKKNETTVTETPATTAAPATVDTTMQKSNTVVKDSLKPAEKGENEADEKNEKK